MVVVGAAFAASHGTYSFSGGGTWVQRILNQLGSGGEDVYIAICYNATGGATTVTVNPGAFDHSFSIGEFSGLNTTSGTADDIATSSDPASSSTPSLATGALAQADELIIGGLTHNGATTGLSVDVDGTFIQLGENENNGSGQCHHAQYRIVSSASSDTVAWSLGAARTTAIVLASLKAPAASGDTQEWRGCFPPSRLSGTPNISY